MQIAHKKNTAYYLAFPMISDTSPKSFAIGETVSDAAYYKDGAGAWTSLPLADAVSEIASTGLYEIDLTAAEMNHDMVIIKMTSPNAADTAFLFRMTVNGIDDLSTAAALATAQADLDIITGSNGVTLAASQPNYTPATESALAAVAGYLDTEIASILADTNELQQDWANGGRLDLILDSRASQTSVDDLPTNSELTTALADLPTNSELATALADLPTNAELAARTLIAADYATAAALATVDSVVDRIEVDTQDLQTQIGAAGAGLTAVPWNAAWDAEVQSECADAIAAYDPPTNTEMEARTLVAANYATAAALATTDGVVDAILVIANKLDSMLELDGAVYRFTVNALEQAPSGGGGGSSDWSADERTAIRAILGIPASGTTPDDPASGILDGIRDLATAIKAKTDSLTFTQAGVVDSNVTRWRGTQPGTLDGNGFVPSNLAAINGSTTRATDFADDLDQDVLASIVNSLSAILVDTGTDIPALINALNDITVSQVLTTQMVESYAANGVAPTLAQAIFAIHQHLMDFVIVGTAKTVRRLDSTTTAFTETLNNDTAPTGITR